MAAQNIFLLHLRQKDIATTHSGSKSDQENITEPDVCLLKLGDIKTAHSKSKSGPEISWKGMCVHDIFLPSSNTETIQNRVRWKGTCINDIVIPSSET